MKLVTKATLVLMLFLALISTAFLVGTSAKENTVFTGTEEQYPQVLPGEGNKTQIIHLNKGIATFKIENDANSFKAYINDVHGNFKVNLKGNIATFQVPKTDAYILNVKSDGIWEISYR